MVYINKRCGCRGKDYPRMKCPPVALRFNKKKKGISISKFMVICLYHHHYTTATCKFYKVDHSFNIL